MLFPTLDVHTELQKQLLDRSNANAAVDDVFLQMLADIAGTKWPYLAPFLSFTPTEIKEAKGGKKPLLFLLTEWKERVHATYGDLLDIMSTLYLQTQPPAQMIDRPSPEITHNSSKLLLPNSRCRVSLMSSFFRICTNGDFASKDSHWCVHELCLHRIC